MQRITICLVCGQPVLVDHVCPCPKCGTLLQPFAYDAVYATWRDVHSHIQQL